MLDIYVFYLLTALTLISAVLIFVQKKLIRAVIALTGAFTASALVFLLLGQTLIALIMLIVFVGGLSTYLIVAVGSEEKKTIFINFPYFIVVAVVFFAAMIILLNYIPVSSQASTPSFLAAAQSALQSSAATLYLVVILLFSVTIGSTIIIKKFAKLIV